MKRDNFYLGFFGVLLILSSLMLFSPKVKITGYATEGYAVSNVTITSYLAIQMSANLGEGILFGTVEELPAVDLNASHNYDGADSASTMYIEVSSDSNSNVDFCIKANNDLMNPDSDILGVSNQTYANSTTTSASVPPLANQIPLTKSYVKSGIDVDKGTNLYYRFWLDIPSAQPVGTYNNTILFKGVVAGGSCE